MLGFEMFILMDNYRERLVQGREIDIVEALNIASQCGATDPRDKIFALGGITRNANTLDAIRADYHASYEVLLLNVATACLFKQNSLDILSYVTTPAKATQRGLLSWVPLWGPQNGRHPFHVAETPFKALGHSKLEITMSDSRDVLRISGRVIGIVNQVSEGPNPSTAALQAGESLRLDTDDSLDPRRDWLIKSWELASKVLPYHTREDDIDVSWRSLCCDMMPSGEEASNEYRESFLYYWETYMGLNRSNSDLSKFGMFDGASLMWNCDRVLSTTDNGCLVMGPSETCQGDVVCILYGSDVPFVVRQTVDDTFQFVGECYIHGLMRGEALERVQTDDYVFIIK
jgi:hypothetical protein